VPTVRLPFRIGMSIENLLAMLERGSRKLDQPVVEGFLEPVILLFPCCSARLLRACLAS